MFEEKASKLVDTDVLVIGGGLGGCMAAIKASDLGLKVALMEKAAVRRAGGAVLGLGRTLLVHPDYNTTPEDFARKSVEWGGGIVNEELPLAVAKDSVETVKELESWKIKFRGPDDKYWFKNAGDIVPIPDIVVRVWAGSDLQPLLAGQVKKRKIDIFERTTLTKILVEGGKPGGKVIGATAINVRDGTFIVFRAKSIVLCPGGCYQSYRWKNSSYAPDRNMVVMGTKFGEGVSAAYRAGAEIVNLEFTEGPDITLKDFFAHAWNLAQWTPQTLLDGFGKPLPSGLNLWEALKADVVEGRGPLHFDMRATTPELKTKIESIEKMIPEYFAQSLYTKERPLNFWEDPVEFEVRWQAHMHGGQAGIGIDSNARTNIKGLYAAGDTTGGGHKCSSMGAWVFGARAAKNAVEYIKSAAGSDVDTAEIEAEKSRVFAPIQQKDGYQWFELQDKVRQIVTDYAFYMRSEPKLKRGLERLSLVESKYLPQIVARTPRDLMRALEVQSLFTMAGLHMQAALFRKESRILQNGFHYRIDYPQRDDKNWVKQSVIRNVGGKVQITARDPVRLSRSA
jgi:succinate dehydrogenase/fumarate reductase flavoprotein subunit